MANRAHSAGDQQVKDYVRYFLFKFLEANGYNDVWRNGSAPPVGDKAARALVTIGLEFKGRYAQSFDEMFATLDFQPQTANATFLGISNELFAEGIKWGRILALFVLGGELAVRSLENSNPSLVEQIEAWLRDYIEVHLLTWIREHGGWDGFLQYFGCEKDGSWMTPLFGIYSSIKSFLFRT